MTASAADIIIPVYNEGAQITSVLDSLGQHVRTPFRVLICYDFDEDDTLVALDRYRAPFEIVRVKNRGAGAHAAVLSGFAASDADAVLVFPADDDYNAPRLDAMFARRREGCDIVCASRFIHGGAMVGCPPLKAFILRTSAFVLYHLARVPTHDPSNGFRLFSRRVVHDVPIESNAGFTYSIELLVKCQRLGWRIGEVPVHWYERRHGKSRFRVLRWLPSYLRWFLYPFATTYLRRGPGTVRLRTEAT